MGWCTGTEISVELWDKIRLMIPKEKRKKIANKILDIFEYHDADCYDGESKLEKDADRNQNMWDQD